MAYVATDMSFQYPGDFCFFAIEIGLEFTIFNTFAFLFNDMGLLCPFSNKITRLALLCCGYVLLLPPSHLNGTSSSERLREAGLNGQAYLNVQRVSKHTAHLTHPTFT